MKLLILRVVKILIFISFLLSPQIAQADEIESAYKAVERVNSCSAWKAFARRYGNKDSLFVTLSKEQQKKACNVKPWEKTFGGSEWDRIDSIVSIPDDGAIMTGVTASKGKGRSDAWVVRIDLKGNVVWNKTFGGKDYDRTYSIITHPDGGTMVAGGTESKGKGSFDVWIFKIDENGNFIWDKTFGGKSLDIANSIIVLPDGGAIIAGDTESKGKGSFDVWIFKIDKNGNFIWDKTFGGKKTDKANSIIATPDGGAIIAGATSSKGNGKSDVWVIRIGSKGNLLWDKTFGGKEFDTAKSIILHPDGGAIIAGATSSKGNGKTDAWVIRIDSKGNLLWDKTFGGKKTDKANSIIVHPDGGAIIAGATSSKGNGKTDAWVIRIDSKGNLLWDKTFGGKKTDKANSIIATPDGGAMIAGYTESKGKGFYDAWVFRIDENGNGPETTKQDMVDRERQEKPAYNPCAHVYRGKTFKSRNRLGLNLTYEVVGASSSTGKATITAIPQRNYRQEIYCNQIPK